MKQRKIEIEADEILKEEILIEENTNNLKEPNTVGRPSIRTTGTMSRRRSLIFIDDMYSVNELVTNDIYFEMNECGKFIKVRKESINNAEENKLNNALRMDRIKVLLKLEFIMIVDQLIEGNSKIPSFIGLQR
jgi:hypothetical protein